MILQYEQAKQYLKEKLSDYLSDKYNIHNFRSFSSPFRDDNTPSCNMLPDGTAFYDHGTDETIDIFEAIQKEEGCDYKTAFCIACSMYQVTVEENDNSGDLPVHKPVQPQHIKSRKAMVNAAADNVRQDSYSRQHYIMRGLSADIIERFKLGYTKDGFNSVIAESQYFISESKARNYRYIIPFIDGGDIPFVIGELYDRSLTGKDGKPLPKYVKPYNLKQPLYNEQLLKTIDRPFFVTEGIYDALSIIQQGGQAVALVGTAFTCLKDALSKYRIPKSAVIIISTDNDAAGVKAGKEIYNSLQKEGHPCIVYHFEGGKDCNELLISNPDSLKNQIREATGKAFSLFHKMNSAGVPTDIIDEYIANHIIANNDIFIRWGKLYKYDAGYYQIDDDGSLFKTLAKSYIAPYLRAEKKASRINALLLMNYELKVNDEDINQFPDSWIPFENGFLDLCTMKMHDHSAKYRCIYQIPHTWQNQTVKQDSITEKYLKSFFESDEDLELFLQYSALCMTKDMHFQKMMILRGNGGLGKSVLLNQVTELVGGRNTAAVSMQNLNMRFQSIPLIDKVLNIYADLESADMPKTDVIKMIVGQDAAIPAEYKGGKIFKFKPICKLLFSANRIPKSRDEKTDAMYRRMLIIPFTHQGVHIAELEKQLSADFDSFLAMVIQAGHRLYTSGELVTSENSEKEVAQLYYDTDTVYAFLADECIITHDYTDRIERGTLFQQYYHYCDKQDREQGRLSNNGFYQNLREKGFNVDHKSKGLLYVLGLRWKE